MIEIRRIEPRETNDYLSLLCEIFALDRERARSVFYQEPMYDIRRKWALFENKEIVSILSTTPLTFGWGQAIGIAGVATRPNFRKKGYASELLGEVLAQSKREDEGAAYLFATRPEVYQKNGFLVLDKTMSGQINTPLIGKLLPSVPLSYIKAAYSKWSGAHPNRLKRDERRWRLWQWNLKFSSEFQGGYFCMEGSTIREAVITSPLSTAWPVPSATEWMGLQSLTEQIGVPISGSKTDLFLMGKGTEEVPQMFLTDQF